MEYAIVDKPVNIDSFDKLEAWKAARLFTKMVYEYTRNFPKDEKFGLTNQMRRASSSVPANIAEGFSRSTIPDKLHFYTIAQGSLTEVQSFLYTALDVGYISESQRQILYNQSIKAHKILTGLMKSTRRRSK